MMISEFSREVLKFYECIDKKDIVKSKLSYNVIMSLLKSETTNFSFQDFEDILGKEIVEDNNLTPNKSIVDYMCDFYMYISRKDKINAEISANCIYALLIDDKTVVNMNDFINRIRNDLEKLELNEKIEDNIDKAFYYGICIMDVTSDSQLEVFKQVVEEIPNIQMVPFDDNSKVALLNKNDKKEKINTYELYNEASKEYYNKNYKKGIELYTTLLKNSKTKLAICGRLGLCYMKLGNYEVARDYLLFTTNMNVNHLEKYDYTNLIYKLENEEISENQKVKFKMFEEEFFDDMSDYYGIDNINDIINSVNSGFTIQDACKFMNLTEEQTNLVYLIYARECYYNCDYRNGDRYLGIVQKKKNNSKYVKGIINSLRVNKLYYKNRRRTESNTKILKLSNN